MSYRLVRQSFEDLASSWKDPGHRLEWRSVFVLPYWLEAWWRVFGAGAEEHLCGVTEDERIIGIAPLMINDGRASFIGSADVCDYMDFVVEPGREGAFFTVILDYLKQTEVSELYLEALRSDSAALTHLIDIAKTQGYTTSCSLEDVSLDLELPPTWEGYLDTLSPKQRREVGRKLRRLYEAGDIEYRIFENPDSIMDTMDLFLRLLRDSRSDKAAFMTERMESFFNSIAETMAEAGLLRMGVLSIHTLPVASIMSFDYNDSIYLYNSGYDPPHGYLSVGLLSKVFSIKDSIERGRKRYDFLKGAEEYKYRLGGREIPIHSCRIALK
ncbi:MAG: GNAT family N-acetyltransferase [Dehalococcoidia bacterium]|nr:MAG: GNAT family N-acetyltransferase [Dehalococcoidia bacterium]